LLLISLIVACGSRPGNPGDTAEQQQVTYQPTWTRKSATGGPGDVAGERCAYDSQNKRVLFFGGAALPATSVAVGSPADTFAWNGSAWTKLADASVANNAPPPRDGFMMAYDDARHRLVVFGGERRQDYYLNAR
jgi:hypothetical protein